METGKNVKMSSSQNYNGFGNILGDGKNKTVVNKALFLRFPVQRYNEKFDFTTWHKKHGREPLETKVLVNITQNL